MRNPWDNVALGENMPEHLLPADLGRLVQGTLSLPDKRRLLGHLLQKCQRCLGTLARYVGVEGSSAVDEDDYDAAVSRAIRTVMSTAAVATLAALLADDRSQRQLSATELAT